MKTYIAVIDLEASATAQRSTISEKHILEATLVYFLRTEYKAVGDVPGLR